MFHRNEKGQLSIYDILIAFFLFIFLFIYLRGVWFSNLESLYAQQKITGMQLKANQVVTVLISSQGYPTDWEENWETQYENIEVLGLGYGRNELSEAKLQAFKNWYENLEKQDYVFSAMQVGPYRFRFFLDAEGTDNDFEIGVSEAEIPEDKAVITVKRVVVFKGGDAVVTFSVFE